MQQVEIYDPAEKSASLVTLTASAVNYIQKELKRQNAIGMRLSVKKSGCSGYVYVVDYVYPDTRIESEIAIHTITEFPIYIPHEGLPFLQGVQIDCVRNGLNTLLKFINPNEKGSCGCGESFTV